MWVGPGFPRPSWHYTLDSTLNCLNCVGGPAAAASSAPTATYVGGHARWRTASQPAGADGAQTFYQWRDGQAASHGTEGSSNLAGTSMLKYWGSVWVSAIAHKANMADSDVVRSQRYYIRRIAAAPSFTPDGGTHDAHLRTISVTLFSATELASIRFVVDGTPTCGSDFLSCTGTLFNSYFKNGLGFNSVAYVKEQRDNAQGQSVLVSSQRGAESSFILGPADTSKSITHVIRAISYRDGWSNSDITTSAVYTLKQIVASPTFTPNGGAFSKSPLSVALASATPGVTIRYTTATVNHHENTAQQVAVYPSMVGEQYLGPLILTSQMATTSTALATTVSIINVSAIATKAGYADSDVMANIFAVGHVEQWSEGGNIPISQIATDFVKSGLTCQDVLDCKGMSKGDSTVRVAQLELATGECVCK